MTEHDPRRTNKVRYGTIDRDYGLRLATTDPADDGPVWMFNLMKYREVADYIDGTDEISGREADDRYTPIDSLRAIGASIVFAADVEDVLLGDGQLWDRVGVVKYPTRRSFIEMQSRPEFQRQHVHKDAGMERTIVIGCLPLSLPNPPEPTSEVDWTDVPHPPTDDDGPVVVLHVIRFHESDAASRTPSAMQAYQSVAAKVALRHGLRIAGWFGAEGTIIGDGREWHQLRFNTFPSKRAFLEVVRDPERLAGQREFREAAIADTYTMILRPSIDLLLASTSAISGK